MNGECRICRTKNTEIRNIDLYVNGSEGLNICHSCEMLLVEYVRGLQRISASAYKNAFLNKKITDKYISLLAEWDNRTKYLSNPNSISNDPACKQLIHMGKSILPLIFEDLKTGVADIKLLILLKEITGLDPVKKEHEGDIALMINDWINNER